MKDLMYIMEAMKFFHQYSDDIIILGSSESGLYLLKYDETGKDYLDKAVHIRRGKIQFRITG